MGDWDHPDDEEYAADLRRRRDRLDMEITFWSTITLVAWSTIVYELIKGNV